MYRSFHRPGTQSMVGRGPVWTVSARSNPARRVFEHLVDNGMVCTVRQKQTNTNCYVPLRGAWPRLVAAQEGFGGWGTTAIPARYTAHRPCSGVAEQRASSVGSHDGWTDRGVDRRFCCRVIKQHSCHWTTARPTLGSASNARLGRGRRL